jgi:hypothetical protein
MSAFNPQRKKPEARKRIMEFDLEEIASTCTQKQLLRLADELVEWSEKFRKLSRAVPKYHREIDEQNTGQN